jgi:hypothetical protein
LPQVKFVAAGQSAQMDLLRVRNPVQPDRPRRSAPRGQPAQMGFHRVQTRAQPDQPPRSARPGQPPAQVLPAVQEWAREDEPLSARYQVRTLRPTSKVDSVRRAFEILAGEPPRGQGGAEVKLVWKKTPPGQGATENLTRRLFLCLASSQVWSQYNLTTTAHMRSGWPSLGVPGYCRSPGQDNSGYICAPAIGLRCRTSARRACHWPLSGTSDASILRPAPGAEDLLGY